MNNKNTPATKKDIENLATKAELKALEQKLTGKINAVEQKLTNRIDSLDTRVGRLETLTKNMALDMVHMRKDIDDIKEHMATKDDISRIMSAIDTFAAESYPTATAIH